MSAPAAEPEPEPTAVSAAEPEPKPSPNCMLKSMGVDSDELALKLNVILKLVIELMYNKDDPCKKQSIISEMKKAKKDMECFMKDMKPEAKQMMGGILGPLLKAVGELLEALLGSEGVLGGVGDLLSTVLNLVLCLLNSLGLNVDIDLMLRLGNLLNLDLSVLLNLG